MRSNCRGDSYILYFLLFVVKLEDTWNEKLRSALRNFTWRQFIENSEPARGAKRHGKGRSEATDTKFDRAKQGQYLNGEARGARSPIYTSLEVGCGEST